MADKESEMLAILQQYYSDFLCKKDLPFVVKYSVPVAWFGDCEKYFTSENRVVTVGLNPSFHEFENPLSSLLLPNNIPIEKLYQSLNDYFAHEPYRRYFGGFEALLNILDASYGGKFQKPVPNTAIHIDVFSSIATNPMWGDLTREQKIAIDQYPLFQKLFDCLSPNLVMVSIGKKTMQKVFQLSDQMAVGTGSNKIEIYHKNSTTFIYGRNFKGTPFYARQECVSVLQKNICGNLKLAVTHLKNNLPAFFEHKGETYEEPEFEYILVKTSENSVAQRGNLYEATRYAWKLSFERARHYKYVFSVIDGIVREVYFVSEWRVIAQGNYSGRLKFSGEIADRRIADRFIGKHIPAKYCKQGCSSPALYKQI